MYKFNDNRITTIALYLSLGIELLAGALLTLFLVENKIVSYVFFGLFAVLAVCGIIRLAVISKKDKDVRSDVGMSFLLILITVVFIAALPIVFLMWIVELIVEAIGRLKDRKILREVEEKR